MGCHSSSQIERKRHQRKVKPEGFSIQVEEASDKSVASKMYKEVVNNPDSLFKHSNVKKCFKELNYQNPSNNAPFIALQNLVYLQKQQTKNSTDLPSQSPLQSPNNTH